MSTSLAQEESPAEPTVARRLSERGVILTGAGLIVIQLAFRAWALSGSWFQVDDFGFLSRIMSTPLRDLLLDPYLGHVMPGGFLLSWMNYQLGALEWVFPATELLLMQAIASVGCLVLLLSAFGRRPGILPPLAIYLFSVISLPAFIWWAAGVNQLPMQIALFWGLLTHLAYLRTRRAIYAVLTMLITVLGLVFYEKTLLILIVFAIVTVAYFAQGDIVTRLRFVWAQYRLAVVGLGVIGLVYTALYASWALTFSPNAVNEHPLGPVVLRMAVWGFGTGVLGGPLRWAHPTGLFALAEPAELVVVAALVALLAIGLEMTRTRTRAKRAWLIPAVLLVCDVLLVVAGRTSFGGPAIAEDYRYQSELAGAAAIALGLSLMPLLGAIESAQVKRQSAFFDRPVRVLAATMTVACLAVVSSVQFTLHWQGATESREYFTNVRQDLSSMQGRVPLVNVGVPGFVILAFGDAKNDTNHMLRMYSKHTRYASIATDRLYIIAKSGHVVPVVIPPVREEVRGPKKCGWFVDDAPVHIKLNGPVFGAGWWIRMGYIASGDSPVTVTVGSRTYTTRVSAGVHNLYFETAGEFRSFMISGLKGGVTLCTGDVALGQPGPYSRPNN